MEPDDFGSAGGNLRVLVRNRAWILVGLIAALLAVTRMTSGQEPSGDSSAAKTSSPSKKVRLSDVTRVSTEETARQAAKQKTKSEGSSTAEPQAGKSDQESSTSSTVTELQPARKTSDEVSASENASAGEGKSKTKRIHGSVHGTTGSGGRQGGAEVGTGSKSGKTHVYVETERASTPQPH